MDDLDSKILYNASALIMEDKQGTEQLLAAAGNSADPAVGVAQYIMMLMQALTDMLTGVGIEVNPEAWLAEGGAVDLLLSDVAEILAGNGMEPGEDFDIRVNNALLERVKAASQAEMAGQPPQAEMTGSPPQAAPQPAPGAVPADLLSQVG